MPTTVVFTEYLRKNSIEKRFFCGEETSRFLLAASKVKILKNLQFSHSFWSFENQKFSWAAISCLINFFTWDLRLGKKSLIYDKCQPNGPLKLDMQFANFVV